MKKILFPYIFLVKPTTSMRSEQSSYQLSYMGRLGDTKTVLKPFKKIGTNLNKILWSF